MHRRTGVITVMRKDHDPARVAGWAETLAERSLAIRSAHDVAPLWRQHLSTDATVDAVRRRMVL